MGRNKEFYMKFNVNDFRTSANLCDCSAEACGVYIFLLCLLWGTDERGKYQIKSDEYKQFAGILPQQNDKQNNKQNDKQIESICLVLCKPLAKHLPFDLDEIKRALVELLRNNVLYLEGSYICQKRMVEDARISKIRSNSGKNGAEMKKKKRLDALLLQQNEQQNGQQSEKQIDQQTNQQKEQQNPNYNSNYNYNYKDIGNEGGIGNEYGGSGEENLGGEKEKGESKTVPPFMRPLKFSLAIPVDDCLANFIADPEFASDRRTCVEIFAKQYVNFSSDDEAMKVISLWAVHFNEVNRGKKPQRAMRGDDSWVQHLTNWLKGKNLKLTPPEVGAKHSKSSANEPVIAKREKNYSIPRQNEGV